MPRRDDLESILIIGSGPIVIGHPGGSGRDFGWIVGLSYANGELCAGPHQVNTEFEESAGFFIGREPKIGLQ